MSKDVRPRVVVSKCLGFAACRYNGVSIPDPIIDSIKKFVDFEPVCPEMEIGLGVPRDPIRIVAKDGGLKLIQPSTGRDITDQMTDFCKSFLGGLKSVDGFILKHRSPSCGLKGVKIYAGAEKSAPVSSGEGFFGAEVQRRFALLAIEDEGRLKNFGIREHFLTRLFAFADFRILKSAQSMGSLVEFHASNKLMLMAYSQKELRLLGKIVANHEKLSVADVWNAYEVHFQNALMNPPKHTNAINVLMHALGYFSDKLSKNEKKYFLDVLHQFKNKKVPLSVPVALVKSYIARFGEKYLDKQTFFSPYPEELLEVTDSGKGKDIIK